MSLVPIGPLANRLAIIPIVQKAVTDTGIHIPNAAITRPVTGVVAVVGPDVKGAIRPRDVVCFGRHTGIDVEIQIAGRAGKTTVSIFREDDIIAVLPFCEIPPAIAEMLDSNLSPDRSPDAVPTC